MFGFFKKMVGSQPKQQAPQQPIPQQPQKPKYQLPYTRFLVEDDLTPIRDSTHLTELQVRGFINLVDNFNLDRHCFYDTPLGICYYSTRFCRFYLLNSLDMQYLTQVAFPELNAKHDRFVLSYLEFRDSRFVDKAISRERSKQHIDFLLSELDPRGILLIMGILDNDYSVGRNVEPYEDYMITFYNKFFPYLNLLMKIPRFQNIESRLSANHQGVRKYINAPQVRVFGVVPENKDFDSMYTWFDNPQAVVAMQQQQGVLPPGRLGYMDLTGVKPLDEKYTYTQLIDFAPILQYNTMMYLVKEGQPSKIGVLPVQ